LSLCFSRATSPKAHMFVLSQALREQQFLRRCWPVYKPGHVKNRTPQDWLERTGRLMFLLVLGTAPLSLLQSPYLVFCCSSCWITA